MLWGGELGGGGEGGRGCLCVDVYIIIDNSLCQNKLHLCVDVYIIIDNSLCQNKLHL